MLLWQVIYSHKNIPIGLVIIPFAGPDPPDFLGRYHMSEGSDYAQQTSAVNIIDDIYSQTIYNDLHLEPHEYIGLTLGVKKAPDETLLKPMYGQSSILIRDNDSKNLSIYYILLKV